MFYLRKCFLYHTDFVEDFLEYPFKKSIKFKLTNKYYESEKIDVLSIFEYCKEKYNYVNDEMHYFNNTLFETKLRSYNIYFDIINHKLIIPFDDMIADKSIIKIGELNSSYKDKMTNEKELYFET